MRDRLTTTLFLRLAAVLTVLYALGHTSGYPWTPALGPEHAPVIEQMQTLRFEAEGAIRTYWDFYVGFGVIISGLMIALGVVLWQLGTLAREDALRVRPIAATIAISFAVNAVLSQLYFFALPTMFAVAIVVSTVAAIALARRAS
ncbi:LIC_13387 family protein [Sandaracinus amylolyticus]|uniref:Uncharacterized protein n=1 Tax=Sandaracinus amylolyticus TaxID=927083 RepID=A0A0F6YPT6_9BACT|nr:hypothetical protein [Sandaracinus amylolyticus]AKF11801.1 hypothetical protein DB32_008950 [Sandaracinus amylolyticus]